MNTNLQIEIDKNNALYQFSQSENCLPNFAEITADSVENVIKFLLQQTTQKIQQLADNQQTPATWENFVTPLNDCLEQLSKAWGVISHFQGVKNTPEWREIYNRLLPEISIFFAELGQNEALFSQYKNLEKNNQQQQQLNATQLKILNNELTEFRLGGADLPENQKIQFKQISQKLSELTTKFAENVLDETNEFLLKIPRENQNSLQGLPENLLQLAEQNAKSKDFDGYIFTLQMPCYVPFMQYAENRELRKQMYFAYTTRASEFSKNQEKNNDQIMLEILQLRQQQAKMLGYKNFAELSLVQKMANSTTEVLDFLRLLANKAKPFALKDLQELKDFVNQTPELKTQIGGGENLQSWDLAYVSEKLRQAKYAFSELEVRNYFPIDKVLQGLFHTIETLYNVKIIPQQNSQVWHKDVQFFKIIKNNQNLVENSENVLGYFYLDLYARPEKSGGAWMNDCLSKKGENLQKPVAYLVCNFTPPLENENKNQPSTLTHDEVCTLFHETGHGLHHLLTQVTEPQVAGINGVEWDAVELPSQFMENFCWEYSVIKNMSQHIESGETLPKDLFDKMYKAKNFQSGMQCLRQVEFALFDFLAHCEFDPNQNQQTLQDLIKQVRKEVAVIIPPEFNRFENGFSHIFAGGYAAGYFSYKWAEVLSADAFESFLESGNALNAEIGAKFLQEILSVGGSRSAEQSFIAFKGRKPKIDALLKHSGMQ